MVIPFLVLIGKQLRRVPILRAFVDERFLSHRRRAQRAAGLVGFLVADVLFGDYKSTGKLAFTWPRGDSTSMARSDPGYKTLYPFGAGL